MNILIAEDNLIVQLLYQQLMEDWCYSFDMASNGIEAVELALKNKYDLCLMDIEMPEMDGIEASRIIRRVSHYFPIIGLATNGCYKKNCYDAGIDYFAIKPCLTDNLFSKINTLFILPKLDQTVNKSRGFLIY